MEMSVQFCLLELSNFELHQYMYLQNVYIHVSSQPCPSYHTFCEWVGVCLMITCTLFCVNKCALLQTEVMSAKKHKYNINPPKISERFTTLQEFRKPVYTSWLYLFLN